MKHKKIFRKKVLSHHQRWKIKRYFQTHKWPKVFALIFIVLLLAVAIGFHIADKYSETIIVEKTIEKEVKIAPVKVVKTEESYKISAKDGYLLGRYGNALDLSGDYTRWVAGSAIMVNVRPGEDHGQIEVVLPDVKLNTEDKAVLEGEVKLVIDRFKTFEDWQLSPFMLDEYLFGNTGNGFDLLPKTRVYMAAFGEGDILLDDQEVYDNLKAMVLYTEGIRDEGVAVKRGDKVYTSKQKKVNYADKKDRELHIFMFSDEVDKKNFPPRSVWVNVMFEEPRVISVPEGAKK